MGMNYFFMRENSSHRYHIGKLSMGWSFAFHGYDEEELRLKSRQDWENFLLDNNVKVFDEEDEEIEVTTLLEKINQSMSGKKQTAGFGDNTRWYDSEGFIFYQGYFS